MHAQRVLGFGLGPRLPAFGPVSSADQVWLPGIHQIQQISKEARKYLKAQRQGLAPARTPSIGARLDANLAQQREELFQARARRAASVGAKQPPPSGPLQPLQEQPPPFVLP